MSLRGRNRGDTRASLLALRLPRAFLYRIERARERREIEPRAAADDRHPATRSDRVDRLPGLGGEVGRRAPLSQIDHVEHVMRYARPLVRGRLRRADLELAIDLSRIRDHDL